VIRCGVVGLLELPLNSGADRRDFVSRLFYGGRRSEPGDHLSHAMAASLHHEGTEVVIAIHHIQERLGTAGKEWRGLQHADHRHRPAIELHLLADDAGIAAEALPPALVGQHHNGRNAGPVVGRLGDAAKHGGEPHDLEIVPGHEAHRKAHGPLVVLERHGPVGEFRDAGQRRDATAEVPHLRHGEGDVVAAGPVDGVPQVDQAVALAVGQGLEQHAAHDAEDGRVGADT
jgi:hypothetical protein